MPRARERFFEGDFMGKENKKVNKNDIRNSLLNQLAKKGANIAVFRDLIDDYITLYDIKKKCSSDIKKRGVTFEEKNCKGELVQKENPSVKNLINTNKQMLSIIDKLKLDPNSISPEEDKDDCL